MIARLKRIGGYAASQLRQLHPRLMLAQALVGCMPFHVLSRPRAAVYRWAGFKHIEPRVHVLGMIAIRGWGDLYSRLEVGEGTSINHSCDFDLNADVVIGRWVGIGNHVVISTSSHTIGPPEQRCGLLV